MQRYLPHRIKTLMLWVGPMVLQEVAKQDRDCHISTVCMSVLQSCLESFSYDLIKFWDDLPEFQRDNHGKTRLKIGMYKYKLAKIPLSVKISLRISPKTWIWKDLSEFDYKDFKDNHGKTKSKIEEYEHQPSEIPLSGQTSIPILWNPFAVSNNHFSKFQFG